MTIIFEDKNNKRINIGHSNNIEDSLNIIKKYIENNGFKVYYFRTTKNEAKREIFVDFGSHVEFCYILY